MMTTRPKRYSIHEVGLLQKTHLTGDAPLTHNLFTHRHLKQHHQTPRKITIFNTQMTKHRKNAQHNITKQNIPHSPTNHIQLTTQLHHQTIIQYKNHIKNKIEELKQLAHKVQEDTACTMLDCCSHLHKLCLHNYWPQRWEPDSFF